MTAAPRQHLAQFNWATMRHDPGDPRVAEFMNNVARMNTLAERMPGFVWRHLNDRTALRKLGRTGLFAPKRRFTTTLSVWTDLAALERYAFKTVHSRFYGKRGDWFVPHEEEGRPHIVFWHVPVGHRPGIPEAVERAEHLIARGDTEFAFGWDWASARRAPEDAAQAPARSGDQSD